MRKKKLIQSQSCFYFSFKIYKILFFKIQQEFRWRKTITSLYHAGTELKFYLLDIINCTVKKKKKNTGDKEEEDITVA